MLIRPYNQVLLIPLLTGGLILCVIPVCAQPDVSTHGPYGSLEFSTLFVAISVLLVISIIGWYGQWKSRQVLEKQKKLIEQQARELQQQDMDKSVFFANVSHELRTPLTLILGPVDQVLKAKTLDPQHAQLLQTARRNGAQLLNLFHEILDFTKINAVVPELQEQPTVLFDFLNTIKDGFLPLAEARGISLSLEMESENGLVLQLDRLKVIKVLNNLLSNALRFAPPGGQVVLRTDYREQRLTICVQDDGPGIHPDDLPFVFNRFYQARHSEVKAQGGAGIGLSLSQELARFMGGELRVESEPGQGSLFCLDLPVREAAREDAAPVDSNGSPHLAGIKAGAQLELPSRPGPGEAAAHLLIVEDHAELRQYLQAILPAEYCLTMVDHGRAALRFLEESDTLPDLVISDLMMPVMDGFQLVETMRKHAEWRFIPVIFLTARAERSDLLQAFHIGIDDYLVKPFTPDELLARIDNALRNAAARREWQEVSQMSKTLEAKASAKHRTLKEDLFQVVRENIGDPQFNVDQLAELLGISRTALYRSIRQEIGLSANQFIQETRLQEARVLLESGRYYNLRTIAEAVGFRSPDYFSRLFRERFGISPAELL